METDRLIEDLSRDLAPVRRLRPTSWRLAAWFAVALVAGAVVVVASAPPPELLARVDDPQIMAQLLAALATALVAGWVALAAGIPGTPGWAMWLPAAPLAVWLAALGRQCWEGWLALSQGGFVFNPEMECFGSIALVGALPAVVLIAMIRNGARFRSTAALVWGSLAVALFANAAHLLFHEGDAGILGVMVQAVSVALILGGALACRRSLLARREAAA